MGFADLFLIAVGLSMDAFAVAVCKGLGMRRLNVRQALVIALFFGGFQALMPVAGWLLGTQFEPLITPVDHWIAFVLLAVIGGKMLWEAFHEEGCAECDGQGQPAEADLSAAGSGAANVQLAEAARPAVGVQPSAPAARPPAPKLDLRELTMLAVATSIDALAVGITFAFLRVDIAASAALIGVTTFALSLAGVAVGHRFGARFERTAAIAGGIVLILIGTKILLEHLGILVL